jgi:hypothetical protein
MDLTQQVPANLNAYDYEDITVDGTVGGKGFTATKVTPTGAAGTAAANAGSAYRAKLIIAVVETGNIRYSVLPSVVPVSGGPGIKAVDGAILSFGSYNLMKNFRAIQDGGTPATLRVFYYR